jgi:signal transduction histidine kinase
MEEVIEDTLAADRLVSVGKLSGSLGHELNNLLTGILVFAETLSKGSEGSPRHEDSMEILTAARRATDLLKGFVQFSQGGARHRGMASLIEGLRLILHYRAHLSAMRLELEVPPTAPAIHGAALDFQHLVVNLVLRAIEGGQPGQTVSLGLEVHEAEAVLEIWRHGQPGGGGARAWLPRVEQDLSVAAALARRLGGTLALEDETRVRVTLPIAEV